MPKIIPGAANSSPAEGALGGYFGVQHSALGACVASLCAHDGSRGVGGEGERGAGSRGMPHGEADLRR
eukprot:scaffold11601_cov56-Isochrysis_galbana.AAC.1